MTVITTVVHGRSRLALHELRAAATPGGRPLLLLHGLGESSPRSLPAHLASWPGPVLALDFTGHGHSTRPLGGGYTAEILMGDVDAALARTGPVTVLGRGLGAYIALLVAAARPDLVRGAVLTDGPGLVGGGVRPASPFVLTLPIELADGPTVVHAPPGPDGGSVHPGEPHPSGEPDPLALFELANDVRPPDYAVEFMRILAAGSDLDQPLVVCTIVRPGWLAAVIEAGEGRIAETSLADALARYAGID
jgi:pimeloyl-ACP methyl ester carboxylesterase